MAIEDFDNTSMISVNFFCRQTPTCSTEDDKYRDNDKWSIEFVLENEADGHPQYTHDGHIVHRHANIFGVVEGRDLYWPGFPSQKGSKELQ